MTSVVHCIRPGEMGEIPIDQSVEGNCKKGGQNTGGQIRSRPQARVLVPQKVAFGKGN